MIVTEKVAFKNWCPFARVSNSTGVTVNRSQTELTRCIGSKCMAWRVAEEGTGFCGNAGTPADVHYSPATMKRVTAAFKAAYEDLMKRAPIKFPRARRIPSKPR